MGPGPGAHRHRRPAGRRRQPAADEIDQLETALHRVDRLQRMDVGKARHPRHLLVEAGIVLHRARPAREKAKIDRIILARQASVVPYRLRLAEPGKSYLAVALHSTEPRRVWVEVREIVAGLVDRPDLEQPSLFEHQGPIAGDGLRLPLL